MTANRIQKLLFKEYSEFQDMVLIESPFAQTTREGKGIRQVQVGLTPTKMILAIDIMWEMRPPLVEVASDPDIESLELLSIFPVECVNISVFRRRSRNTLKVHLCNNQVLYFELAVSDKREMFWNLWCERVKFLCPEEPGSTQSETSVGSSSSDSTLYLKENRLVQWDFPTTSPQHYYCTVQAVNRFGLGIKENCCTSLYLPILKKEEKVKPQNRAERTLLDIESGVLVWEGKSKEVKVKHRRRQALATCPYLLYAFGPWKIPKPQSYSLQLKRACSAVCLNSLETEPEFRLDVPTGNLVSSPSIQALSSTRYANHFNTFRSPLPFCSSYYYKPRNPRSIYIKVRSHLEGVRAHLANISRNKFSCFKREDCPTTRKNKCDQRFTKKKWESVHKGNLKKRKRDFGVTSWLGERAEIKETNSKTKFFLKYSKKISKFKPVLTTWDFDSRTLAYQMTLIDRDLFLQITAWELIILNKEKSSINAPNLRAVITFSHRICNLVASEILKVDSIKMRARMIARYINVADKLHNLSNMASCRSVLYGLQSPAIFRMVKTWNYVRHHHSTKYQRFALLLRFHKDPKTKLYEKMWEVATRAPPYLPSLVFILCTLLGKIPWICEASSSNSNLDISVSDDYDSGYTERMQHITKPFSKTKKNKGHFYSGWHTNQETSNKGDGKKIQKQKGSLDMEVISLLVGKELQVWQGAARAYAFVEFPTAMEFLLKARHSEEKENFFLSKNVEP